MDTEASDANSVMEQPAPEDEDAQSKESKSGGFGFGFGRRKKRGSRKTAPTSAAPAVDTTEALTTEDDPEDLPSAQSIDGERVSVEEPQLGAERRRSSVLNPTAIDMQDNDADAVPGQARPSVPQSPPQTSPAIPSEHDADDPVDRPVGRRRGDWIDGPSGKPKCLGCSHVH